MPSDCTIGRGILLCAYIIYEYMSYPSEETNIDLMKESMRLEIEAGVQELAHLLSVVPVIVNSGVESISTYDALSPNISLKLTEGANASELIISGKNEPYTIIKLTSRKVGEVNAQAQFYTQVRIYKSQRERYLLELHNIEAARAKKLAPELSAEDKEIIKRARPYCINGVLVIDNGTVSFQYNKNPDDHDLGALLGGKGL